MKEIMNEIAMQRFNRNAFEEWREYRKQLTDIVIHGTEEGCTLAVYGAGLCNDIDLERLADHFSEITLLDLDEEAMERALQRYGISESEKIRIRRFDFVGISEVDYERLGCSMNRVLDQVLEESGEDNHRVECIQGNSAEKAAAIMMRAVIEDFYALLEAGIYRAPRYDAVLAAGLHSQLNQTAVSLWRALRERRGLETDPLHDPVCGLLHEKTLPIITRFNQLLFYSARSKAFIAYEKGIEGRQGGVQGAMQLKDDLDRRMRTRQISLVNSHRALWPQNRAKGMVFDMAVDEFVILK